MVKIEQKVLTPCQCRNSIKKALRHKAFRGQQRYICCCFSRYLRTRAAFCLRRASSAQRCDCLLYTSNEGAVSTLYLCFAIKEDVVLSNFAKWYFESSQWHRGINEICAEGARNHGLLNVPTDGFFDTVHILPSDIEEQAQIAAFLSRIHAKLAKAKAELDKLIGLRNGLMQQLFI